MSNPGHCQRQVCCLPLVAVKQGDKMRLLHVHQGKESEVRKLEGRNGCKQPKMFKGEP